MSMPNIPNITPIIDINRCDTINLLLSSIALEEISLSHLLNAEGEKLQHFLKNGSNCIDDFLTINESINRTLRTVVKSQLLLQLKLEDVIELDNKSHCGDESCDESCYESCCESSYESCDESCDESSYDSSSSKFEE